MKAFIVALIVIIARFILAPLCIMWTWNAIAWEFNLPPFGFWIPFGICMIHCLMQIKADFTRED